MPQRPSFGAGAHEPGCPKNSPGLSGGETSDRHIDVFCDCHRFTEPKILSNGTDVAWPSGWGEKQAADWRERNNLVKPS